MVIHEETHMADVIMDDYTQVSQGSSGHHHDADFKKETT